MSFTVKVEPSGRLFTAQEGETVLGAAIRQGIGLPYGCKDGACGSCKCKKLEGQVTHGPHQSKALSSEEEAQGLMLACCAVPHSDLVIESRQVTEEGAFPVRKMPARVSTLERASPDVMLMKLQLPANEVFKYHAGQYVEFLLRDGDRRSYSMANAPHTQAQAPVIELHLRHMPGGKFTDTVFSTMKERDLLRMEAPLGTFYLREESTKPVIFLASGTGFAPIKSIIEFMLAQQSTRPITLYWGCRSKQDLYLMDLPQQWAAGPAGLRFVPVLSEPRPEDAWSGRTGFVHRAVMEDFPDLSGHQVYACGAPAMVEAARTDFTTQCRLPEEEFFADSFLTEADHART